MFSGFSNVLYIHVKGGGRGRNPNERWLFFIFYIDLERNSITDYFTSLTAEEIMRIIDISDSFERTALA